MSYTPDSPIIGVAIGSAATWTAALTRHGADQPDAIAGTYFRDAPLARLNADLALAQAVHETGWFTSDRWLRQRNPAGIGITSGDVPGHDFGTIERGVQAHLAHLCCYVYTQERCPVGNGLAWYDPRHTFHDGWPALRDLIRPTRRWADPGTGYVAAIVTIANAVVGGTMAITPIMPPLRVAHLPAGAANRPGVAIVPRFVTIHETANESAGANAEMHRRYVHGGGGPQQTSYNYVVDDREAVELVPIGENSHHAGTAAGNTSGIAIELCVNSDGDWGRTLAHGVGLVLHLYRTVPSLSVPATGLVNHGRWRATQCPARLRANDGALWHQFTGAVVAGLATPPEWHVGPGIRAAMAAAGDRPLGPEREVSPGLTRCPGEKRLWFWSQDGGHVYDMPRSGG